MEDGPVLGPVLGIDDGMSDGTVLRLSDGIELSVTEGE